MECPGHKLCYTVPYFTPASASLAEPVPLWDYATDAEHGVDQRHGEPDAGETMLGGLPMGVATLLYTRYLDIVHSALPLQIAGSLSRGGPPTTGQLELGGKIADAMANAKRFARGIRDVQARAKTAVELLKGCPPCMCVDGKDGGC